MDPSRTRVESSRDLGGTSSAWAPVKPARRRLAPQAGRSFDRIVDLSFSLTDGAKRTFLTASKFGIEVEEQETKKFKTKTVVLDFEAKQIDDTTSLALVVVVRVKRE